MTRIHRNAAAGETLTVHPGGTVLHAELHVEPVHHAPPAHVHPHATERFTVVEGAIRIRVGRRRWTLHAGESATVPAGVPHGYAGVPGVQARVLVELDPAGRMAEFFDAIYGIAPEHRVAATGAPTLRAAATVLRSFPDDIALPGLPRALTRPLLAVLAR